VVAQTQLTWQIESALKALNSFDTEVARQRSRLKQVWDASTASVNEARARLNAVETSLVRREAALKEFLDRHSNFDYAGEVDGGYGSDLDEILAIRGDGSWSVDASVEESFDSALAGAQNELWEAARKTFGFGARRRATEHLEIYEANLVDLRDAKEELQSALESAIAARKADASNARDISQQALSPAADLALAATLQLPAPMQPWSSAAWESWTPPTVASSARMVYGGTLTPVQDESLGNNSDFGCSAAMPLLIDLSENLNLVHDSQSRSVTLGLVRALVLRSFGTFPAGKLQCTLIDPTGLGQSFTELLELAEYDPTLIGGKVWSSPPDIQAKLYEQTAHIELVIQKYLRSNYESLDEFNEAAGEIDEPYRLLVIADFPSSFTEDSFQQLRRIIENGPRCGIHTILVSNTDLPAPYGVDTSLLPNPLHRIVMSAPFGSEYRGYSFNLSFKPDIATNAEAGRLRQFVESVGRASGERSEAMVTFDKTFGLFQETARRGLRNELPRAADGVGIHDPTTWWPASTTVGVSAPIGIRGARDVTSLTFDSGDHSGALLVGRPGAGKSTLLHTFLAGVTTLYSPGELELYLIDFKEGVEFKMYATHALPHARCVAIETDREFGLSVLQSLESELSRRGELLRSTGGKHAGLESLRRATNEKLPRVLLVFDEFHVLFSRNDKIGLASADLLELLIRQGRGFGMHVLLGSQSLAGLDALGAHVPQLLPVRILLPSSESDARRVLGEGNDEGQYLTHHGEGILNPSGGAVEANERFKGALITEDERMRRLELLREKADQEGHLRRPLVFEGNAAADLEIIRPSQFCEEISSSGAAPLRLRVGTPMTIHGTADLELRRESGANVMLISRDARGDGVAVDRMHSVPHGLVVTAIASAACSPAIIDIVDFTPIDDGLDEAVRPLAEANRITVHRRRALREVITERLELVRARMAEDDMSASAALLVLFGVHRARDLDASSAGFDGDQELLDGLEEILRDGPEFGVHTWIWSDSVSSLSRRLPSSSLREFSWRIATRMSPDDSQVLLGVEAAADLRNYQILIANDDIGVLRRCTGYSVPSAEWIRTLLQGMQGNNDA